MQPIYCLADSQLLFWHDEGAEPWLHGAAAAARPEAANGKPLRAAYVGASNGDEPAFYSIFSAAMESAGVTEHRMILSRFDAEDRAWLATADLILLAGGDPLRGWRIFEQSGLREAIAGRYFEGATLMGISAGAVQLGWLAGPEPTPTFRLVPAIVGAHDEENEWGELRRLVAGSEMAVRGLGIPSGGGFVYHQDGTIEPVRHPVHELVREDDAVRHSLLFPEQPGSGDPASTPDAH